MAEFNWGKYEEKPEQQFNWSDYEEKPKTEGFSGIAQDVANSFSNLPEFVSKMIGQAPSEIAGGVAMPLGRSLKNLGHGGINLAELLVNPAGPGMKYLSEKNIPYLSAIAKHWPQFPEKDLFGLGEQQPGDVLWQSTIPFGSLARASKGLKGLTGLGARAGGAGLYAGSQGENPLQSALLGSALEGAFRTPGAAKSGAEWSLEKGKQGFNPYNYATSPLTKKELVKAYQATKGTTTDLGNVIENPFLQRLFENRLPKQTPHAYDVMQNTASQVTEKGNQLMQGLLGGRSSENIPADITKDLQEQYRQHQTFKNSFYDAVDKLGDKVGLKLQLPNFSKEATKYMDAINDTTLLKHEPDAKLILNKLINYAKPVQETTTQGLLVDKQGNPLLNETKTQLPTLKEANILKGKLNHYANTFASSPDPSQRNIAGIFGNLAKTLKNDIESSIKDSGNLQLKVGYEAANKNYAKNFSPFLDRDIYKFISGNADPETIVQKFLTTSRTQDLAGKLSKLAERFPQGSPTRSNLAYAYLSRAFDNEGNFHPAKFATAIRSLGKNQFKALFPDLKFRAELLKYTSLINKNKEPLSIMFNPKTGQRGSDIIPHSLQQIAGGLVGGVAHGTTGGLMGALLGPMMISKFAKGAVNKLTSEELRRKVIKNLVAKKK